MHNTRYRLERWVTPEGVSLIGQLPLEIGVVHFGPQLRAFILYQYHHAHVTQPLLLEQLREWQIDISSGQLSALITDGHSEFHREKDALLQAGLQRSRYVHVDDTGARHQGKNGYCTHIGNERFAWFASTDSKSRINSLVAASSMSTTRPCCPSKPSGSILSIQRAPLGTFKRAPTRRTCDTAATPSWAGPTRTTRASSPASAARCSLFASP